jgi:hypothetical protein
MAKTRISIVCSVYEQDGENISFRHTSPDLSIEGEAQLTEDLFDYDEQGKQLEPSKVRVSFDLSPHDIEATAWRGQLKAEGT